MKNILLFALAIVLSLSSCLSSKKAQALLLWLDTSTPYHPLEQQSKQKHQWGETINPENWSEEPIFVQGFEPEIDKIYQLKVKKSAEGIYTLMGIKMEEANVPEGKRNLHLLQELYDKQVIFYARGQEPGWGIDLYNQGSLKLFVMGEPNENIKNTTTRMDFLPESRKAQITQLPSDIQLQISPEKCQDPMSGEPYNYSVTYTREGKTYYGCGTRVPNPQLEGTYVWGKAVDAQGNLLPWAFVEQPYLRFDLHQYQIMGSGGCNKIQAALDAGRSDLFIHFLLSTRKYCEGVDESLLTKHLNNTLFEYSFEEQNQTLVLKNRDGLQMHWKRKP
jgi:uncharacterized membrane protein/heat shock protein HslJ